MGTEEAYRVVVADDSMLYRHLLEKVLAANPDIDVAAMASDGEQALALFRAHRPDAVVLDLNMPKLNGFEVLERILKERPVPVIMMSAGAAYDGALAVQAVARGAIDLFIKPSGAAGMPPSIQLQRLGRVVVQACRSRDQRLGRRTDTEERSLAPPQAVARSVPPSVGACELIAIGASTGGICALTELARDLGPTTPPIVVAQHMPRGYTESLAAQLDKGTSLVVVESREGLDVTAGMMIVCAADDQHTVVRRATSGIRIEKTATPKEHHQRPAVDPLFRSVAEAFGASAVGILLTGMGRDGAAGLLAMRRAGAVTIAESERTATIFGMPRAAIENGAAQHVLDLTDIRQTLSRRVGRLVAERTRRRLV